MSIFDKLMALDRRWVFLFLIVVCVISYSIPFDVPILVTPEVRTIYDRIESLEPGEIVFIPLDYDPGSMAELHPMTYAIIEQCWRKDLKVLITALSQNGPGLADQALREIADSVKLDRTYNGVEYKGKEVTNGIDYCFIDHFQ